MYGSETVKQLKHLLPALGILSLTACFPNQDFNRQSASSLITVAIAGPEDPTHYPIVVADNISATSIYNELDAKLKEADYHLGRDIQASLAKALVAAGYQVSAVHIPHKDGTLLTGAQVSGVRADAVLDANILLAGYVNGIVASGVTPNVLIDIQLLDVKTGTVLFGRRYNYSNQTFPQRITALQVDARYTFMTRRSLADNFILAGEGLSAAGPLIAQDLAAALHK